MVVADIDTAIDVCTKAGIEFQVEQNDPAPRWSCRRHMLQTPSGTVWRSRKTAYRPNPL
jgi:hypothetical protein